MSFTNALKACYGAVESGNYPVFVGIRQATQATPCIVFEVQSCELVQCMKYSGTFPAFKELWNATIEVVCVADSVADVAAMVDDVGTYIMTGGTSNGFSLVMTGFTVAMSTETPDDGQQDAERIGTITLNLQLQET